MRCLSKLVALAALVAVVSAPASARAQTFALDPASATLGLLGVSAASLLTPAGPAGPGPLPPPAVAYTPADLGLLPGDAIDAISFGDEPSPSTLYFTVSRGSVGAGAGAFTPDVFSEATGVAPGIQPDASADIFSAFDPLGPPGGANTQVLDGDGVPLLAPLTTYTGLGLGLVEGHALPGPPSNDQIADFDWGAPGRGQLAGSIVFSLAPGSPTLTPGTNPNFPSGAEPGDVLFAFIGPPSFYGMAIPAAANGLVSGGPGCAPPACDDIDAIALGGVAFFSLAAGSPSLPLVMPGPGSGADVFLMFSGSPPVATLSASALGLAVGDDVKGLEVLAANPCPIAPAMDGDGDGVDACDNCPAVFNPSQEDSDSDGIGDACDTCTDTDGDGFANPGFPASTCGTDLCPFAAGPNGDGDGDGRGDTCDNCPAVPNPSQADLDSDSVGDACDSCNDVDGDGFGLPGDACAPDNCPVIFDPSQADGDGDTVGNVCDNCPAVPNPGQEDPDDDFIGSACDNCPAVANLGQDDADGDLIGDACDICTGGVGLQKPSLKFNKLLAPAGDDQLGAQGDLAFPGALPSPPMAVHTEGMRVEIVDLGNDGAVVLDHTIPGGTIPNACGSKDGWKVNGPPVTTAKFATKTDTVPPACTAGSALGIAQVQAQDRTATLKGAKFKLKGSKSTYAPVIGPFRMTVVLGGAAEGAAGQCATHVFAPDGCVTVGGGKQVKCK